MCYFLEELGRTEARERVPRPFSNRQLQLVGSLRVCSQCPRPKLAPRVLALQAIHSTKDIIALLIISDLFDLRNNSGASILHRLYFEFEDCMKPSRGGCHLADRLIFEGIEASYAYWCEDTFERE